MSQVSETSAGVDPSLGPDSRQPSVEERRLLIERVAGSEQFSRSARLRDLLLYIGRQSLKEDSHSVHEQEIGIRVFGRSPSYDRSQDNIVRVNATELRKRVNQYFAGTGATEPLVFEIPRGTYKPVFYRRGQSVAPSAPSREESPSKSARPDGASFVRGRGFGFERTAWVVLTAVLAVACLCLWLWLQNRSVRSMLQPWTRQPAVGAFWSGFLNPHREVDLVLPDDSSSVIEDISNAPIDLDDYLSRSFIRQIQSSPRLSSDRKQDLSQLFKHNLTTFGAVRAATEVMREIPAASQRYLVFTRSFTADQLARDNAVLIGGLKAVPWDHVFDDQLNFITDYDYKSGVQFVRNRHPKPGEKPIYAVSDAPDNLTGYAVAAYLPNPGHTGHTIILAGTDSDATGAAAEFLTSERKMEAFRTRLHRNRFPYFEVLLKISRLSGTFFGAEPIAYRVYPDLH